MLSRSALVLLAALAFVPRVQAQEWTRFRGPNGSGISDAATIPTKVTAKDYNWRVKLPGEGHGSPVVWGDKIFLMAANEKNADRFVVCLGAKDGAVLWSKDYSSAPSPIHKFNSFGASTPAVDANGVYVYWASENLIEVAALTHDGKELWRKPLGGFKSQHGPGVSPMVYKDMVIVANDQDGDSFLIALDAKTGAQKWKTPRKSGNAAYGVPCLLEIEGKTQLILSCTATGVSAVDADTGTPLWALETLFKQRVVASPVVAGDLILSQCGQGGGGTRLVAVKAGSSDGKPATLAYDITKGIPYVPTPLVHKERIYMVTDGGFAVCLKAADGEVVWQERITVDGRNTAFFGSPVCVNGNVYAITRNGELVVFKADDKFELLGISALGEPSHATPAISGGKMYLRTTGHLISVGGK